MRNPLPHIARKPSLPAKAAVMLALSMLACAAYAQDKSAAALPSVTVSAKANKDPVEKSYRKMIRGMDLFERQRSMSPQGVLRFKLLQRQRSTDMNNISIEVLGTNEAFAVPLDADQTFTLERNSKALAENAQVTPNRRTQSMTWRTDIRTPGLPANTRRLGDLRLECQVGMEAGLVSNSGTIAGFIASALVDTPSYCEKKAPRYLFFSDKPLFSVTLVNGPRREILAMDQLYGGASDDPKFKADLSDCDCELLVDRTYFLPLGDLSWPDDTLVEFEYMDD